MHKLNYTTKVILIVIAGLLLYTGYLYVTDKYYIKNVIDTSEEPPTIPEKFNYLVYYGKLDENVKQIMKSYDMVILHPQNADLQRSDVHEIQEGLLPKDSSDDVKVIAYISVGEDLRTAGISDESLLTDPRFYGDKTGPRVDPRGVYPDGNVNFSNIDVLGAAATLKGGYASYYLDDTDRDGLPDRNKNFDGCFVNAGDPKWFKLLDEMRLDSEDKLAGLREILSLDYGRGLGCDGVFLDTIDTCAPNSFTSETDQNPSEFEWTAPGFNTFIKTLDEKYPNALIVQNRGLFFFNHNLPHFKYRTTANIDFLMFESYRLNSNTFELHSEHYFLDYKSNYMPKIMAEAHRENGFKIISLGYAEGPESEISKDTLLGKSKLGYEALLEDISETVYVAGFNHYITDANVTLANTFVMDHINKNDTEAPVWSSTYNDHYDQVDQGLLPTPRIGIQAAEFIDGKLVVQWDVALDMSGVAYNLYYQEQQIDFKNGPELTDAQKVELTPQLGKNYEKGSSPDVFANQDIIEGLDPSKTYYLVIRATDTSPNQNEEKNLKVLRVSGH